MKGTVQVVRLGDVLKLRKDVVHPHDKPSGPAVFVGLEHIESGTGRRIGAIDIEMSKLTGRKPRFYKGDIVYGYLRPYLNKVWIAEFDGLCSVDQYVYEVDTSRADPEYIAWFMRSAAYLERAPVGATPGQLPRIRTEEVAAVQLALPSLDEQRRLVKTIRQTIAGAFRADVATDARLEASTGLEGALYRRLLDTPTASAWPRRPLAQLLKAPLRTGLSRPYCLAGRAHCLTLSAVRQGHLDVRATKPVDLTESETAANHVRCDALYMVRGNGNRSLVGRAGIAPAVVPDFLVFPDLLFEVVPDPGVIDLCFLNLAWQTNDTRSQIESMSRTSAGIYKINTRNLSRVEVPVPSLEQQRQITETLSAGLRLQERIREVVLEERAEVRLLPAAILRRVFSGGL